jgi:uncharacterized Zn-binding protein involved in type VI secretion
MPQVTRIGDADVTHCTSMVRASGSSTVFANGIGVSRQGDLNTPHLQPPCNPGTSHSAPIAAGSSTVFADGKGVGRVGDAISGCTAVATGSPDVYAG